MVDIEALNAEIAKVMLELANTNAGTEEYGRAMAHLEMLHKLRDSNKPPVVSPDTMAIVLGNLAGILLIVGHERMSIVSSKALSFVLKPKLL